ncbi:hypothetical protein KIW84_057640 [Lathyrus oleraceus]|uniref:Aminotransferase-like plant mobile domain-containing protein n=1 Tax=Pisum sativum TaxID=3888 RepID=A0A9D5AIG9_PEA|nr:hypothetical protein KIW84_057640 [Pisum sativum]
MTKTILSSDFTRYIKDYHVIDTPEVTAEEHIAFLAFWLSRCIFCYRSLKLVNMYLTLANQLHEGKDVCLDKLVLGSLYEYLGEATEALGNIKPKDSLLPSGPFFLLQLWLNATFETSLKVTRHDDINAIINGRSIEGVRLNLLTPTNKIVEHRKRTRDAASAQVTLKQPKVEGTSSKPAHVDDATAEGESVTTIIEPIPMEDSSPEPPHKNKTRGAGSRKIPANLKWAHTPKAKKGKKVPPGKAVKVTHAARKMASNEIANSSPNTNTSKDKPTNQPTSATTAKPTPTNKSPAYQPTVTITVAMKLTNPRRLMTTLLTSQIAKLPLLNQLLQHLQRKSRTRWIWTTYHKGILLKKKSKSK